MSLYNKKGIYPLLWLRRIRHSRGFGVQSPTAYSFIRYVINEHYPYYAYSELAEQFPSTGWCERKLFRLYLRIANHVQAAVMVDLCGRNDCLRAYVKAGCHSTEVVYAMPDNGTAGIVRMRITDGFPTQFSNVIDKVDAQSIVVIEDIHRNREARKMWRNVVADRRTGRTFDLYYCGIVTFDLSKYKQHYKVNF